MEGTYKESMLSIMNGRTPSTVKIWNVRVTHDVV